MKHAKPPRPPSPEDDHVAAFVQLLFERYFPDSCDECANCRQLRAELARATTALLKSFKKHLERRN